MNTCAPALTESITETAFNSFRFFYFDKFSVAVRRVEGIFKPSKHLISWASILQAFSYTSIVSARKHLKTAIAQGYIAWKLYRMEYLFNEWEFMGYLEDLAEYHLKKLKRYINALPECFGNYKDLTSAESILNYRKNDREFICAPSGILTFKRGRHPHGMILDDILRDPQKKLDLAQLEKIERIFLEEVMSMPRDELHIFGTPQDQADLFSKIETLPKFYSIRCPAIKNLETREVLWPELYPYDVLIDIRDNQIGEKAFNKEYMCMPVRTSEGFISLDQMDGIINMRLRNYDLIRPPKLKKRTVVAGFDIGKKTHPSHLSVLVEVLWPFVNTEGKLIHKKKLVQIHSKFMDGWNYTEQIAYLREAIRVFTIDRLLYDNTRSEFEECYERGELPPEMEGVSFTAKSKFAMATEFDKAITTKGLELINDNRQKRQILSVDCDLRAPETSEGHGDSFFSLCLAMKAWSDNQGDIAWIA